MPADGANGLKWTREQRLAIETTGRSLLVSAAAGSGKTAVLAERCAHLVCDADEPCDVHELLVVTFTRAAAEEMRIRIHNALAERLAASKNDARLRRQLMLLERAEINTVHGFCTSVLHRHFNLVGLDPNFRMLDEQEAQLMRLETARELLARRYEHDESGAFQRFVDRYADGNDESLLAQILRTHDLLCSVVDPEGWLARTRNRIDEVAQKPFDQATFGRSLASLVSRRLSDLEQRCVKASELEMRLGFAEYAEQVNELLAAIQSWSNDFGKHNFDALARAVSTFKKPNAPAIRADLPNRTLAKKVLDELKTEIAAGAIYQTCRFSTQQWIDGMKQILEPADVFIELVREFGKDYRAVKDEVGSLDFSDLERMTFDVLRTRGGDNTELAPSPAAIGYHAQFKHVLVDEYQDINELQDAILSLVSRECVVGQNGAVQNLFAVGDVKQSIYRFRLADPKRFMARDKRFRDGSKDVGEVIDLQSNFRSRGPLLSAINSVFERMMTKVAAEIRYDESHRLKPGLDYPQSKPNECFAGAPIELHLLPPLPQSDSKDHDHRDDPLELDRTEREAGFVAHRIHQMLGDEGSPRMKVFDKSIDGATKLRPIRFGDIVVLLRTRQFKAQQFAAMLRAAGVPVHTESGTGFFASIEIRDMVALLDILDNAQQDIPLAAVLRSPLGGLADPEDCLARIRLASHGIPFHRAVVRYVQVRHDELAAHLKDLLDDLSRWRQLAHQRPLAEVLWKIYDETGYLAFCSGLADGEQRVANLIELHERARQFGSFQRQGLCRFMKFLQSLQDESRDLGQPSVASEADDVVRVMTIHGSKGLEFPVVFLPDLAKKHNLQDAAGAILVDREAGLGLACVDEVKGIRYPSLASLIVQERIRRQSLAEEMRVLYVAMTRAREHLVMVGTCKPDVPEAWRQRWQNHAGALPDDDVLRGASMLDWIGPVAVASSRASPRPIEIITHDEQDVAQWTSAQQQRPRRTEFQQQLARLEPLSPAPIKDPGVDALVNRLTRGYPHDAYTRLSAVQTVGSLTKVGQRATDDARDAWRRVVVGFRDELASPRCALPELKASPTDIGSATHLVLEHLDLSRACTRDDVAQQIDALIRRRLIAPAMAGEVDVEAIAWLMETPLGVLLRTHAKFVRRELRVTFPEAQVPQECASPSRDPLDRVMIRGRIDALIPDGDGLVLIDYKTDRVTKETIDERAEQYRAQVTSYRDAVAKIARIPVKAVHLVFLNAREIRTV